MERSLGLNIITLSLYKTKNGSLQHKASRSDYDLAKAMATRNTTLWVTVEKGMSIMGSNQGL